MVQFNLICTFLFFLVFLWFLIYVCFGCSNLLLSFSGIGFDFCNAKRTIKSEEEEEEVYSKRPDLIALVKYPKFYILLSPTTCLASFGQVPVNRFFSVLLYRLCWCRSLRSLINWIYQKNWDVGNSMLLLLHRHVIWVLVFRWLEAWK